MTVNKYVFWITICFAVLSTSCQQGETENQTLNSSSIIKYDKIFTPEEFKGKYKPKVSILGTFHFSNSDAHDFIDQYSVNGLSDKRQKELQEVIDNIKSFRPTKILIERNRISYDSIITSRYDSYKKSDSIININDEAYLIAFPLAKYFNHKKVYSSDATADWFGINLDWDNFDESNYLKSRNQYEKSNRYDYETIYKKEDSLKSVLPLLEFYRLINSLKAQRYNHQIYLTETVLSGAGDNYIGADAVARWYRRNLRIFSNTLDLVEFNQEERILIIYGASHVWTLKQFFQDSPDFDYVEINSFLQ